MQLSPRFAIVDTLRFPSPSNGWRGDLFSSSSTSGRDAGPLARIERRGVYLASKPRRGGHSFAAEFRPILSLHRFAGRIGGA